MRAGHLSIKPGRKEQCADTMQRDASIENEKMELLFSGYFGGRLSCNVFIENERGVKAGYPKRVVH